MLVLNRKIGQVITIGTGKKAIHLKVLKINNKNVVLGFTGDTTIPVFRQEIVNKRKKTQEEEPNEN